MTRSVKFILLTTTILAMTSLAANGKELIGNTKVTVVQPLTATQKGRVRVSVQKIQKPKIFVGNPHKITLFADDTDVNFLEVDDIITAYRREDLQRIKTDPTDKNPEGLSEEIQWRLFLARQLALMKHREIHS
jgi:hypothetical protein